MVKRIALHAGTATGTVCAILDRLNPRGIIEVVENRHEARTIEFDGLMLLGGADISPFFYGEAAEGARGIDKDRDVIEWTLSRRALAQRAPIFGICRGMQMLAVAAGASLYQDLTDAGYHHTGEHIVKVSCPALDMHMPSRHVNSLHHQAVRAAPYGFEAAAFSPDGVIEAIYKKGVGLGVQWHPELLYAKNRAWDRLFAWFLAGLA
jgi:putative glutamine amidotransferase